MAKATKLVFKQLTPSDFYWINQPGLARGGGQSYIDFDTSDISAQQWESFFAGCQKGGGASGPHWTFSVNNLGADTVQTDVKLGQRRSTSFSIRSQKLREHSRRGRRLHAWSPHHTDFPSIPSGIASAEQLPFALIAELRIFLVRDSAGQFWAGWTRMMPPGVNDPRLERMFERKSGLIDLAGDYEIDPAHPHWPFKEAEEHSKATAGSGAPAATSGPGGDPSIPPAAPAIPEDDTLWDPEDELSTPEPGITYSEQQVRKRNQAAARAVRKLYTECQITGGAFAFLTSKGKPYLEVHHLIPLGRGGADSAHNMIVVSAHAHKMLHHAEVSPIDLSKIEDNKLDLTINGQPATITWHPKHAAIVLSQTPS